METAQVVSFENSGVGFFSNLAVGDDTPLLAETSPLSGAYGDVVGIEHGMGFIVFLKEGRIAVIEGYCNGDTPPATSTSRAPRTNYGLGAPVPPNAINAWPPGLMSSRPKLFDPGL